MAEFTLQIDGMHCGSCVRRVSQALASTQGVAVERSSRGCGAAQLQCRTPAPVELAIAALAKAGYTAHLEAISGHIARNGIGHPSRAGHDLRGVPASRGRGAALDGRRGIGARRPDGASRQRGLRSSSRRARSAGRSDSRRRLRCRASPPRSRQFADGDERQTASAEAKAVTMLAAGRDRHAAGHAARRRRWARSITR